MSIIESMDQDCHGQTSETDHRISEIETIVIVQQVN